MKIIQSYNHNHKWIAKDKETYSSEATLINALLMIIGHNSFPLVVKGSKGFIFSSQGIESSTIILR